MVRVLVLSVVLSFLTVNLSQAQVVIDVYKSPSCGCCKKWISHLEQNGFKVNAHDMQNVVPKKIEFGIAPQTSSCHTAMVDGYVIEGHVPASDIQRLLQSKPKDLRGLSVPGMPVGSPGMEQGDRRDHYNVIAIEKTGKTRVFSSY